MTPRLERALALAAASLLPFAAVAHAQERPAAPDPPRIDFVAPSPEQPHADSPATIWSDDFDDPARWARYAEKAGEITSRMRLGAHGGALEMHYAKGTRGTGGLKVFFGDSPAYRRHTVRPDEVFTDVYWRVYVKHQRGWKGGGPAKLSRATSLVSPDWRQAMIAHVWSSGEALTLDPASGVRDGAVVTTKYNDFEHLRWLGNRPPSTFELHSEEESGRWVCVEARARLNAPGEKDGVQQLWIDGRLEAERTGLDWRGTYAGHGINAVFLEAWWNDGSPIDQSRWIDAFVVSTAPIGPVVCPRRPTLRRTLSNESGAAGIWEVQVAAGASLARRSRSADVVWRSRALEPGLVEVRVNERNGRFEGSRVGKSSLAADTTHFVRVRQRAKRARWTDWHQPFMTGSGPP